MGLVERFKEFAKETDSIGSERVAAVNEIADSLISVGHTDAATIAQWKDSLNDAWADLGELIDTRNQMLEASRELHKYFHDCKDVLSRILEKRPWKSQTEKEKLCEHGWSSKPLEIQERVN